MWIWGGETILTLMGGLSMYKEDFINDEIGDFWPLGRRQKGKER